LKLERKGSNKQALFERKVDDEPVEDWAFENWSDEDGVFLVKTMQSLEPVLAQELEALGGTEVQQLTRAVTCRGDLKLLYKANYQLRTALRVLIPVHAFQARDERQFYAGIRELDWSKYLGPNDTLAVTTVMNLSRFTNSQYMSLLCKDAVVDQFRERFNQRPSVNLDHPKLRIHVHIRKNRCQILLDSSGDSLHLRGYRRDQVTAPLSEVLAAGMILLSGWDGQTPFVDPMCGSGTLPIEAALIAKNKAPQFLRERFAFQHWPGYNSALFNEVVREAKEQERPVTVPIIGSDKDSRARNSSAINLMTAGLEEEIEIERRPFNQLKPPAESGILITNPPYDERLELDDSIAFYQAIGDTLKHNWSGWSAWIISANQDALKHLGLRPSRNIKLLNGALDCAYQRFDMYSGSKKNKSSEEEAS
jgi:putative N6-adenine-specific DNA methylase